MFWSACRDSSLRLRKQWHTKCKSEIAPPKAMTSLSYNAWFMNEINCVIRGQRDHRSGSFDAAAVPPYGSLSARPHYISLASRSWLLPYTYDVGKSALFWFFFNINISLFITEFLSRDSLHHDMCFTVSWRSRNSRELRCRRHRRRSSLELAFPLLCVFNLYQVKKWSSVWNWISVLGGKNFSYFLLFSCAFLDF